MILLHPRRAVTVTHEGVKAGPFHTLLPHHKKPVRRDEVETILCCRDGCDLCTRIVDHVLVGSGGQLSCKVQYRCPALARSRHSLVIFDE